MTGKWRDIMPSYFKEQIIAVQSVICTYDIMLTIIKDFYKDDEKFQQITKVQIKEILIGIYIVINKQYKTRLVDIFNEQGKQKFSNLLKKGHISIENILMDDNYYLTNIDIWLLTIKFNLPIIFYSSYNLTENKMNTLLLQATDSNEFYFIKCPALSKNTVPIYRLLQSNEDILISLDDLENDVKRESGKVKYKLKKQFLNYIKYFKKRDENYFKQFMSGTIKYKFKGGNDKLPERITL